MAIAIKHCNQL